MSETKMRAAVIAGPRTVRIDEVARPAPKPDEVRVKVEGCGLCGSNAPTFAGRDWFKYPLEPGAPGHEGWGVVDAVGRDVRGLEEGMRVAFLSGHAFAEYDVTDASSVVRLPREVGGAFPGEPVGCAMNVFRRSDVRAGQTVAIVGIGFLGAILTKLCADAGARVVAITRRPFALELAKRFGAHELVPMDDHRRIVDRVTSLTNGAMCERVIEVVGEQWPLDLAGELTAVRGRLVVAGYHQDGPRQVNMWLWNWRGLDVVNAHERDPRTYVEGMKLAVDAVSRGRLDLAPLLTHRVPMSELGRAFELMEKRPDGFVKALVTP